MRVSVCAHMCVIVHPLLTLMCHLNHQYSDPDSDNFIDPKEINKHTEVSEGHEDKDESDQRKNNKMN